MKKIFLYLFLVLIICNITQAQSSLPECEGNKKDISKFSKKYFKETINWVNCHGTAVGPKGQRYIGEFYYGKFHGQGKFIHKGREYIGQWKDGKKHGQGTYSFANGDQYVGEWKDNKYFGQGSYIYSNGDKYAGEWKKDKYNTPDDLSERHGYGILTYTNGDQYAGKWKKGLRHGKGTFTYVNGKIKKGIWKNDKFVESAKNKQ
jgi:hypothetical protein